VDAVSVTAAAGFRAAGVAAGIKRNGRRDLALVDAGRPVPAAGVFTTNRAAAAPVRLSRTHLGDGTARAVVINSGCANAATGAEGDAAAVATADAVAAALGCRPIDVLVCSTGTIGTPLPLDAVVGGVAAAAASLAPGPVAGDAAAEAIMTTDSVVKEAVTRGGGIVVGGMAKGAGMIRPDMATMLAVITTDALVDAALVGRALRAAVDGSFHALNVDGCPSTNDTVLLLASGDSGILPDAAFLSAAVGEVCRDLARQIAADAEGATRVVTVAVSGAPDDAAARRIGRAAADSALVRAAFYGGDPNWGRIVGALGATDLPVDYGAVGVAFAGVTVAAAGVAAPFDEPALLARLETGDFTVAVTVGDGPGRAEVLTTDLTPDYVRFNGDRS
jgi:glutamate N-acetyltransferase / amino-acid N-acetyltransferase